MMPQMHQEGMKKIHWSCNETFWEVSEISQADPLLAWKNKERQLALPFIVDVKEDLDERSQGFELSQLPKKKVHGLSYQLNLLRDNKREGCHLKAAI